MSTKTYDVEPKTIFNFLVPETLIHSPRTDHTTRKNQNLSFAVYFPPNRVLQKYFRVLWHYQKKKRIFL